MRIGSNNLTYPFDNRPKPAKRIEVAPGVFWLRMPLPISLNHINLWLLEDDDGWTIVDTGMSNQETKSLWESLLEHELDSKPVKRVIGTHMHLDHIGLAGWLCRKCQVDLWMPRAEYLSCRVFSSEMLEPPSEETTQFYKAAGFGDAELSVFHERFQARSNFMTPMPTSYRQIRDGENIRIGDFEWTVMVGTGHSPEHACLYCKELNVFIAGDQNLPRITPNVSVRPDQPSSNPLGEWLTTCEYFKNQIGEQVLILPSHGDPFYGGPLRLQAIIDDHLVSLEKLSDYCNSPRRVVDVFPTLFKGKIEDHNLVIATCEALAHLNYLLGTSQLSMDTDPDGVKRFQRS
ncbi:MAG: MBL fold metallo-hydrolase [Gammaproteobacteria bacterium]|nr:MBL fold metallo-hydrolase [Gammaproteobacteria bacterium]